MSYRSTAWRDNAECRSDMYFSEWPIAEQKKVCSECPVTVECIEDGLDSVRTVKDALDGPLYGGLSHVKFAELVRKRNHRPGRFGTP